MMLVTTKKRVDSEGTTGAVGVGGGEVEDGGCVDYL